MLTQKLSNRKPFVDILALMFGIGAWVGVNGIYVQLPLLIKTAPEKWGLPASMVLVVQFANLGPLLHKLYVKYIGWVRDRFIIYGLLGTASLSMFILAFIYDKYSFILGSEHSTSLLSVLFITAFVGCTSAVLFMPYMRNYREIYLVSYLVGEGLSGFIPSVAALIQGIGSSPCINITNSGSKEEFEIQYPEARFSSTTFFIFIGALLFLSFISFISLNEVPSAKAERVKLPNSAETLPTDMNAPPSYKTSAGWSMSRQLYSHLLLMLGIVCLLGNGILPGIQSYSCLPYGNIAYHLTVTLASMAQPLAMCLGFVIKNPNVKVLTLLMAIVLLLSTIILYLAMMSPHPYLQGSWQGEFVIVLLWVLVSGSIGFIKMGITKIFRPHPGSGLYYTGVATQVGSAIGALTTFFLVKCTDIFQSYTILCDAKTGF